MEVPPTDIVAGEHVEDLISGPAEPALFVIDTPQGMTEAEEWFNAA